MLLGRHPAEKLRYWACPRVSCSLVVGGEGEGDRGGRTCSSNSGRTGSLRQRVSVMIVSARRVSKYGDGKT